MSDEKKSIFVIAYLNNPEWVSVPLVGYKCYAELLKYYHVKMATMTSNRPALQRAGVADDDVLYLENPLWDRFIRFLVRKFLNDYYGSQKFTFLTLIGFWLFECKIWLRFRRQFQGGDFALVHRLTPVSPVISSPLAFLLRNTPTPYTIGPINGGLPWPKGYASSTKEQESIRHLRKLFRYLPFVRSTYQKSKAIIVGSTYTYMETARFTSEEKLFLIPENGIHESEILPPRKFNGAPLKVVFIGRLVPCKNCNLVIRALADFLQQGTVELSIIGDGWDRPSLEALVAELGINRGIVFHGMLPHGQALEMLAAGDVLAFPCIREFGGGVILEAMARGLVPIVMRYGGPVDLVDEGSGFRLELKNESETTRDIAAVVGALIASPTSLEDMSHRARLRALEFFAWESKGRMIASILDWVTGEGNKPQLKPSPDTLAYYRKLFVEDKSGFS